jgi:hypothetical protein
MAQKQLTRFLCVAAGSRAVLIHQLSKHQTQAPFKRSKGLVQRVAFDPTKAQLFVAVRFSPWWGKEGEKLTF